jgi:DNA-directed RNA polymerase subunit E'
MYMLMKREDTVRIPPDKLGESIANLLDELTHVTFEGTMEKGRLTVLTTSVEALGDGRIIHGDGGVYQNVRFDALVFEPRIHEIVHGTIVQILKFGAFVRFGPLDGLLHISQIMDDRIDVDETGNRLIGKDTKRELRVGDDVRARIVAITINERSPRESKIGLTMRQPGLGKVAWLEEDRTGGPKAAKKPTPSKKGKGKDEGGDRK